MKQHHKLNYVEFQAKDLDATKTFFQKVFGWSFQDYGSEYTAFSNEGLDGGFFKSSKSASAQQGSPLLVIYSKNLEKSLSDVEKNGGGILQPIFSFPGGRRFHFAEPSGNEFAVWSE